MFTVSLNDAENFLSDRSFPENTYARNSSTRSVFMSGQEQEAPVCPVTVDSEARVAACT